MTEKQKSTVKLVTVLGVIFALIMIIALIYNIVTLANLAVKKNELEAKVSALEYIVGENDDLIDYRGSDDYIERYARDFLNMMGRNDIAYRGNEQ